MLGVFDLRTARLWPVRLGLVSRDAAEVDNAGVLLGGVGLDVLGEGLHHEAVPGHVHPGEERYVRAVLSLVELLHYYALIVRELHCDATPAL